MPIDRTLFNLWVDEPSGGDGSTGTKLTKSRLDSDLLDPIDDALAAVAGTPGITDNGTKVTQIAFPATQVPSADANTFDDYEEGSWTPVIGGFGGTTGQSYSSQGGHYTKKGRDVTASFNVALSTEGTITGVVQIQGLPFAVEIAGNGAATAVQWDSLATSWVAVFAWFGRVATTVDIQGTTAAATSATTALTAADIGNSSMFRGTLCYRTSA